MGVLGGRQEAAHRGLRGEDALDEAVAEHTRTQAQSHKARRLGGRGRGGANVHSFPERWTLKKGEKETQKDVDDGVDG